jgi:hypothetical protein
MISLPSGITTAPFEAYTGSTTVTVKVSPAFADFELMVSFMRTRMRLPAGTVNSLGATGRFVVTTRFLMTGRFRVCAKASVESPAEKIASNKAGKTNLIEFFIIFLPFESALLHVKYTPSGRKSPIFKPVLGRCFGLLR